MADKKDRVVVAVISGLTSTQAAQISSGIMTTKNEYAPHGRGTIATGDRSSVGPLIQGGFRKGIKG